MELDSNLQHNGYLIKIKAHYNFYYNYTPYINKIHQLSITYVKLLKDRNRNILRIRSLMEEIFPEYLLCLHIDSKTSL